MVRRKHFIGMMLMGLLAVAACTSIKAPEPVEGSFPELCAIDSLMWRQPDSALAVLLEYDGNTDGFNGHYAQLLASELLYKNDYEQTNRPELQRAVGYFDSLLVVADGTDTRHASTKTTAFLDARAHYINGVGYYERDSVVEACKEYLKTLDLMERWFEEKEITGHKAKFMALTYTHLTALFSDQYLHEQAIYFGLLSLPYYQKHDATHWHLAWIMDEIGLHYEIMERFDSSAYYYRKAIDILNDTSCLLYRDIVSHQTMLEYKTGNPFKKTLAQLKKMLFLSQNDDEFLARCATIGEIFYHERQFDSALVYLNQVFRESQNEELKKQDAELLVEILKKQGRDLEIHEYAEFLVPFANLNENQGYLKSQLTELCNAYEQGRQKTTLQHKQRETLRRNLFVTLGIVLVSLVGFITYFFINMRRQETERHAHRMQQAALSGKLKKSNEALRDTSKQLEKTMAEKAAATKQLQFANARLQAENEQLARREAEAQHAKPSKAPASAYEALMKEAICLDLLQRFGNTDVITTNKPSYYAKLAISARDKQLLANAVERHCPNFGPLLKAGYPDFTRADFELCRFLLIGLSEPETAVLLQKDYSTIWRRTKRLREMMGFVEPKMHFRRLLFEMEAVE